MQTFSPQTGFLPLIDSDDPVTSDLREKRRYVFTVPYAAPDRFMGDMHPVVDIFSIGCIAYEMVVGRLVSPYLIMKE